MGVIKGSEGSLTSQGRHLDQCTYEGLSHRSQSTFSHQRSIVYALFEAYSKRKKLEGHFDSADRYFFIFMCWIILLIHAQNTFATAQYAIPWHTRYDWLLVSHYHYITRLLNLTSIRYVDEAQDNLLIDALRESNIFILTFSVMNHVSSEKTMPEYAWPPLGRGYRPNHIGWKFV